MLHNEDPGQDNTYLLGHSELAKYWTGLETQGHRVTPYSLADVQYDHNRRAVAYGRGGAAYSLVQDDGISAYTAFGSGLPDTPNFPRYIAAYARGLSQADWCASSQFGQAQSQLCALDNIWCAGHPNGNCAAITARIQTGPCDIFTRDNGVSDQIRIACQCVPGASGPTWVGNCQNGLPCTGAGGCNPACTAGNYCGVDNQCHPNVGGGGGIDPTLLLVGGAAAVGLIALFLVTQPR